jgi:hypothetical protein
MTEINDDKSVHRFNGTVTLVGETYCVEVPGRYAATVGRGDGLVVNVHMTGAQARALFRGLQEALG